jgi:uncharacterized membrane protein YhaH (DUF805 family)
MIIIGVVLSFIGLGYLCWLIFALAVNALPLFAGVTAGLAAYQSNSGPIAAIAVAAIVSVIVLLAGQIAFKRLHSTPLRAVIALLFAVPAAVAGYHAAHGLAHIVVPIEGWRQTMAIAGAIMVATIAWARISLSAPNDAGRTLPLA